MSGEPPAGNSLNFPPGGSMCLVATNTLKTINLPTPDTGRVVHIVDSTGGANQFPITILPSGADVTIRNGYNTIVQPFGTLSFLANNNNWYAIVNESGIDNLRTLNASNISASNISAGVISTNFGFFSTISTGSIFGKHIGDGSLLTAIPNTGAVLAVSNLVATNTTNITTISNLLNSVSTNVTNVSTNLNTLSNNVTTVKKHFVAEISWLKEQIAGMRKELAVARGQATKMQHRIDGFNASGYDREAYDRNGYNAAGYNRAGFNPEGFNAEGYDMMGLNAAGWDKDGYDRNDYNAAGFNRGGYDKDGYNAAGFNSMGYDKNGYDKDGYDYQGYNSSGVNAAGESRPPYMSTSMGVMTMPTSE